MFRLGRRGNQGLVGDIIDVYGCADGLLGSTSSFPKALNSDKSLDHDYVVDYPAYAKADPQFLCRA